MTNALEHCARKAMSADPEHYLRLNLETNVFFGATGKSNFMTPDFLVHRRLDAPYQDVRAADVFLVGEVLSPSNSQSDMEAKKGRYASAGIPWYWEVSMASGTSAIARVRAYGPQSGHGQLPEDVHPLRTTNYLLIGEWTPANADGIEFDYPFPIHIPWEELEF